MADFFRVQLGIVSRAEGHSAAKRSAYQSCCRIVDHEGRAFDYSRKAAEHVWTLMLTPTGAPDWSHDPGTLWRRAAAAERRVDAQEARILDFSMPRAIPHELWEACVRHVYEPFSRMGMALQVDIHDSPASDGGRNINVHGLATLREIEGDGFAGKKNRTWNDIFRERNGRTIREQFAGRLTHFCREHGIEYEGDARPNSERGRPAPEPELPKWNFEAVKRGDEQPEALAALMEHRRRRRIWEEAKADQEAIVLDRRKLEKEIQRQRQRRIAPADRIEDRRDRRAAILRAWHGGGWIEAEVTASIASTRFDAARNCLWIKLRDGSALIDHGDHIALKGPLTWSAAQETAAAAQRHGWTEISVHGDQAYKDAVTMAATLRGIRVTNHTLSPSAQRKFEELVVEDDGRPRGSIREMSRKSEVRHENRFRKKSSSEIHHQLRKSATVPLPMEQPDADPMVPAFRPRQS